MRGGGKSKKGKKGESNADTLLVQQSTETDPINATSNITESPKITHKLDSTNSDKMYTILLVTCYSEGEVGLRTTLDSLTETDYPDDQKLLFVIADGIITGSGNGRSTPDILVDMMDRREESTLFPPYYFDSNGQPQAHSYIAIADGTKRHNMARVYAGRYRSGGHTIPMIVVVKCGTPEEAAAAKPGNRGKRDSQIILMSFLSKTLFDDRMTPLEFDIFEKVKALTGGVTADSYELVLMVDADTQVDSRAVVHLSCAMRSDPHIMGLCGETQIANSTHSWVTAIQVFEYYISHHLSKAFESIFGGVTCLPGCFCMYRIKAPKVSEPDGGVQWVPILGSPDIVDAYSENVTNTLHKKNLLLLGEDRYLTTLMLKTFPKRKMLFVPQALCRTIVPDTFRVLLSQRRRWINSTVHNLFELVLVPDLCGTFCFSMQFVIFMELVGTLVLPAAIVFTGVLITSAFVRKPEWVPLLLLAAILGLPALLIFINRLFAQGRSQSLVNVFWFLCYIIALPLWNFVLPVYAFWHFDDFSWGETRKVSPAAESAEGGRGKAEDNHAFAHGRFDHSQIVLKRWHEYEQERVAKYARFMSGVSALAQGGLTISG
jgi:chitin synthase